MEKPRYNLILERESRNTKFLTIRKSDCFISNFQKISLASYLFISILMISINYYFSRERSEVEEFAYQLAILKII
jgi:hypothetical protein